MCLTPCIPPLCLSFMIEPNTIVVTSYFRIQPRKAPPVPATQRNMPNYTTGEILPGRSSRFDSPPLLLHILVCKAFGQQNPLNSCSLWSSDRLLGGRSIAVSILDCIEVRANDNAGILSIKFALLRTMSMLAVVWERSPCRCIGPWFNKRKKIP